MSEQQEQVTRYDFQVLSEYQSKDVGNYVLYKRLLDRVKELERPYPCSICAGTGKLLTGKPCGCTDGTIHGELHFIRMEAFKAQEQRAAALKLADKWMAQQFDYPDDMLGHYAAAAVRCCVRELRAIYADKEQVSATTARPWDASLTYQEGDRVTYKGEVREFHNGAFRVVPPTKEQA